MNGKIWGRDTVVEVNEALYGDKCIVWQLEVLDDARRGTDADFVSVHGHITTVEYAVNSKCIKPSSDRVTSLNADVDEIQDEALDKLVDGLSGVKRENIIGYE